MALRYFAAGLALIACSAQLAMAAETPTTPVEAEDQFTRAIGLREEGQVGESIRMFQAIQAQQPSSDRTKLEMAVAYYRALNFSKARSLAEEVLNRPSTPESVKVTIRQFITQIEADSQPSVFSPFISLGYVADSNVNAGPGRSVLDIGGAQFTLNPGASKSSDTGFNVLAGVSHRYLFDAPLSVAGTDVAALWQSQAAYYNMSYDTKSAYNLDVLSLSTGPVLISTDNWRLSLPYQVSDIYLGHDHLAIFQTVTPTLIWKLSAWELGADLQYQDKSFQRSQDSGRNAQANAAGLSLGRTFDGGRYAVALTARSFKEAADQNRYSNKGDDYGLSLMARPWEGWEFSLRHNYRSSDYSGVEPVYAIARRDQEERDTLSATYTFRNGALDNWTLGLVVTDTRNHSNISLYDYSRTQTGLNLSRSF